MDDRGEMVRLRVEISAHGVLALGFCLLTVSSFVTSSLSLVYLPTPGFLERTFKRITRWNVFATANHV